MFYQIKNYFLKQLLNWPKSLKAFTMVLKIESDWSIWLLTVSFRSDLVNLDWKWVEKKWNRVNWRSNWWTKRIDRFPSNQMVQPIFFNSIKTTWCWCFWNSIFFFLPSLPTPYCCPTHPTPPRAQTGISLVVAPLLLPNAPLPFSFLVVPCVTDLVVH